MLCNTRVLFFDIKIQNDYLMLILMLIFTKKGERVGKKNLHILLRNYT